MSMLRAGPAPTGWHPAWFVIALSLPGLVHADLYPLRDPSVEDPPFAGFFLIVLVQLLLVDRLARQGALRGRLEGLLLGTGLLLPITILGAWSIAVALGIPEQVSLIRPELSCLIAGRDDCFLWEDPWYWNDEYTPGLQRGLAELHTGIWRTVVLGAWAWVGLRLMRWAILGFALGPAAGWANTRPAAVAVPSIVVVQRIVVKFVRAHPELEDLFVYLWRVGTWAFVLALLITIARRVASALSSPSTRLRPLSTSFLVTGALVALFSGFVVFPQDLVDGVFRALGSTQPGVQPSQELFMGLSLYALLTLGALTVSLRRPLPLALRIGAYAAWVLGAFAFFVLDSEESLRSWSWEAREQVRDLAVPAVRMVAASFFGLGLLFTVPRTKGRAGSE